MDAVGAFPVGVEIRKLVLSLEDFVDFFATRVRVFVARFFLVVTLILLTTICPGGAFGMSPEFPTISLPADFPRK